MKMMFDNGKPSTGNRQLGTVNPRLETRSLKAQAAMEYLMTYGWAILVIVLVLAILYFLLPLAQAPETCQFRQPGFSCSENPAIIADQNNEISAVFRLQNGKGQTINLSRVLCTTTSLVDANKTSATTVGKKISAGSTQTFKAKCYDRKGSAIVRSPTTSFSGIIVVYYNYENDVTEIERVADAVITGKVLGD